MDTIEGLVLRVLRNCSAAGTAHEALLEQVIGVLGCSRSAVEVEMARLEGEGQIRRAAIGEPWKLAARIDEVAEE